jgi:hypothetical protein
MWSFSSIPSRVIIGRRRAARLAPAHQQADAEIAGFEPVQKLSAGHGITRPLLKTRFRFLSRAYTAQAFSLGSVKRR